MSVWDRVERASDDATILQTVETGPISIGCPQAPVSGEGGRGMCKIHMELTRGKREGALEVEDDGREKVPGVQGEGELNAMNRKGRTRCRTGKVRPCFRVRFAW